MTTDTSGLKETVAKALNSQDQRTVTLLTSLLAVQDELGYLPPDAIEQISDFTHSTINDVWGVASFYTNFRFTAPGTHTVELCWGPSCHVVGAMQVVKAVLDTLEMEGEGDTPDGSVTVRFNTCLGACSQGPVISIDHELVGRLSQDRASELVRPLFSARASEHTQDTPRPET